MKKTIAAIAAALMAIGVHAQDWPSKPVQVVVPFPAGGSTDTVARAMARHMGQTLGQSFVVNNRPGATGTTGASNVAHAKPDGYTIMVASLGSYVIAPHLLKRMRYDPLQDFDYLSVPVQAPNVLVAPPSQPAGTVQDVIALLKEAPGQVNFASSGIGSSDHLSAELFWQQTGTQGRHTHYLGGAPAINDLLHGQVDFSFQNINAVLPYIKAGRLKAIAITSTERAPALPEVPTLAEAGVQGAEMYSWQGMAAPKGLPAEVKKKLADAAIAAIHDPEIKERFERQGMEIVASTPEEFTAFQASEFQRWKKLLKARGITGN